ncbi:MAG: DNA primase [Alphaproteobacteria bacterium]|nr:DNA primase [Alphaproteobacteria bacterium]
MFFSPEFLDLLRERAILSEVVSQKVVLKKNGNEMKGLCPFHKEKTPSFHVNDARGFYHCFGCQAHGDVFSFLTEIYSYPFVDAVSEVARITNTPMPVQEKPTEEQIQDRDFRQVLLDLHEEAAVWYAQQLNASKGYNARQYLAKRGVTDQTIQLFRLGYAPSGNGLMKEFLKRGRSLRDLIDAGLLGAGDDGPYDRFRDRLMFPILSSKGNVIAFGGRVLGDSLPKYLNSPETPLFQKKNCLFGSHNLRQMTKNQPTVYVVEGYMDVIAMYQAGIYPAVAPLGTALTEEQIQMLWKACPEPVLCFDGDMAGLNAAHRSGERVLPLLKPGFSLNYAFLPRGEDPDSMIRADKGVRLKKLLQTPRPLIDMLWEHHVENAMAKTPEQKALIRKKFMELIDKIEDSSVKYPYLADIREKFFALSRRRNKRDKTEDVTVSAKGILTQFDKRKLQRYILFSTILNHPSLLEEVEEKFIRLNLPESEEELNVLRDEMLLKINSSSGLDAEQLQEHLRNIGYERVLNIILSHDIYQHAGFAKSSSPLEDAREGWQDVWYMVEEKDVLEVQRDEMRKQLIESFDSDTWTRFNALQHQVVKN